MNETTEHETVGDVLADMGARFSGDANLMYWRSRIERAHARESAALVGVPEMRALYDAASKGLHTELVGGIDSRREHRSSFDNIEDLQAYGRAFAAAMKAISAAPAPAAEPESALLRATRRLVFAARTSGGTAGRDGELCAALDAIEPLLPSPPSPEPRPAEPAALHPKTAELVRRFAEALTEKLALAERKYGYSDNWASPDWMDECREKLLQHVAKGDPRDVAAYCMFLWHHGERTAEPDPKPAPEADEPGCDDCDGYEGEGGHCLMCGKDLGAAPQPAPSDEDLRAQLADIQRTLEARGIVSVRPHIERGASLSRALRDTVEFLTAYLDGRHDPAAPIGDSNRVPPPSDAPASPQADAKMQSPENQARTEAFMQDMRDRGFIRPRTLKDARTESEDYLLELHERAQPKDAASPQAAQGDVEALAAEVGAYYDFGLGKHGPPLYVFTKAELAEFARRLASAQPATAKPAGDAEFKVGDRVEIIDGVWAEKPGTILAMEPVYLLELDEGTRVHSVRSSGITRLTGGSHD